MSSNLETALCSFLKAEDARKLALLLEEALRKGRISYEEATGLVGGDAEDILILAYGWRLLLPSRMAHAGDWEDRMLLPRADEIYRMPNVTRHLVDNAIQTGHWEPEKAIREVFQEIREPETEKLLSLVERMASELRGRRIYGVDIKRLCAELGLKDRVDPIVSELKGCGIVSHKMASFTDAAREGSPIYEFNPSLLVGE
ncbi:MAG: hypothetical protein FJZ83_04145 [Chloroflexi bacterium]|nr:hypothetical protein [Chloroflexota bacterium]MBM4452200.1 hypothetical protein [Chloroflexota bacterium]